jgi:hypothetical protein
MPPSRYPVGTASDGIGQKVGLLSAVGAKGAVAEGKERLPNLSNDRDYSQLMKRVNANRLLLNVASCCGAWILSNRPKKY